MGAPGSPARCHCTAEKLRVVVSHCVYLLRTGRLERRGSEQRVSVTRHPLCESRAARKLASIPIDEALISRLERSLATFSPCMAGLVQRFYAILFARHPDLRGLFPADLSAQTRKLADSLTWVVSHLRQTDVVAQQLHELGRRHI